MLQAFELGGWRTQKACPLVTLTRQISVWGLYCAVYCVSVESPNLHVFETTNKICLYGCLLKTKQDELFFFSDVDETLTRDNLLKSSSVVRFRGIVHFSVRGGSRQFADYISKILSATIEQKAWTLLLPKGTIHFTFYHFILSCYLPHNNRK